ncbi:hypothetical protein T08_13063 [Trichinella sp. T8]|nr:hypothetical protein T08_13063 [Trichinella sp. T8]
MAIQLHGSSRPDRASNSLSTDRCRLDIAQIGIMEVQAVTNQSSSGREESVSDHSNELKQAQETNDRIQRMRHQVRSKIWPLHPLKYEGKELIGVVTRQK